MMLWNRFRFKPRKPESFQGFGTAGKVAFANARRNWVEHFDLIQLLRKTLSDKGIAAKADKDWLLLDNGIYLRPEFFEIVPVEPNGVRTVSAILTAHRTEFPEGIFEYQHSMGDDVESSFRLGFEYWIENDLPALAEVANGGSTKCVRIEIPISGQRVRDVVLGPAHHLASEQYLKDSNHPFCSCCFFTQLKSVFEDFIGRKEICAIRLLAFRDASGAINADCRVNGIDYLEGKKKLIEYANSWPDQGFELRKQYVIIHDRRTKQN